MSYQAGEGNAMKYTWKAVVESEDAPDCAVPTKEEVIAAFVDALKELTGFRYIAVQGDPTYQPPKEAEHE